MVASVVSCCVAFALVNSVVLLGWFMLVWRVLVIVAWFGMIRYDCYDCL